MSITHVLDTTGSAGKPGFALHFAVSPVAKHVLEVATMVYPVLK
jgi:hypothetical protein